MNLKDCVQAPVLPKGGADVYQAYGILYREYLSCVMVLARLSEKSTRLVSFSKSIKTKKFASVKTKKNQPMAEKQRFKRSPRKRGLSDPSEKTKKLAAEKSLKSKKTIKTSAEKSVKVRDDLKLMASKKTLKFAEKSAKAEKSVVVKLLNTKPAQTDEVKISAEKPIGRRLRRQPLAAALELWAEKRKQGFFIYRDGESYHFGHLPAKVDDELDSNIIFIEKFVEMERRLDPASKGYVANPFVRPAEKSVEAPAKDVPEKVRRATVAEITPSAEKSAVIAVPVVGPLPRNPEKGYEPNELFPEFTDMVAQATIDSVLGENSGVTALVEPDKIAGGKLKKLKAAGLFWRALGTLEVPESLRRVISHKMATHESGLLGYWATRS